MAAALETISSDQESVSRPTLAPWQHTVFLVAVLVLWALYGALYTRLSPSQMPLPVRYTASIVMQCLLVGSTLAGVYHRRTFIRDLLGHLSMHGLAKDIGIAIGIFVVGLFAVIVTHLILKATPLHTAGVSGAVRAMTPRTLPELSLWTLVSITAGFCEEFIFRGYLQRQISAWYGSVVAGIAIPTLLFGSLHLYQGVSSAISITVLGFVYAMCAARLGNLRGVMIAHALQDALAGLIYFLRHV